MSANDDKRIKLIESIKTYAYRRSKDLVCKKEEIKCNSKIKQYKMINFDDITREKIKEHNPNLPDISDHPYRILINEGCGSAVTNVLLNLISHQRYIDKILFVC